MDPHISFSRPAAPAPDTSPLVDLAPFGVMAVDADFRIYQLNPAARAVFSTIEGEVVGRDFEEVMHLLWETKWAAEVVRVFRHTLQTGECHVQQAGGHFRIDRGITEYYEWQVHQVPLGDGRNGVVCYFQDVSDEAIATRRLAENEERLSALIHASAQIVWSTGPDGEVQEDLPLWRSYTGQSFEQMRGWGWLNAVHPQDRPGIVECGRRGMELAAPYEMEFRVCHRRGEWRWMVARCVPLKGADGKLRGWIGMNTDVTDRKQAEQTQQLLITELNHRVKNMLAGIQAMVNHTMRQTSDPEDFAERLSGRIQSMARMHTLLSSGSWKGTYLREIIRDQLAFAPSRLTTEGPVVRLEPQLALHLALMLHELGTNSAHYGALSNQVGTVEAAWTVSERTLTLLWMERGGPPVRTPTRRGFGSMLIEQSAKGAGGSAEAAYTADGVVWRIALPLSARSATRSGSPLPDWTGDAEVLVLPGKRFLVVEDEPLVIMDVVGALESAGAEVVSATTVPRALSLLKQGSFDGALVDANLNGRPAGEVAAALTRLAVPFVFVTGYGRESLPAGYDSVAMLAKPFSEEALVAAAAVLLRREGLFF